MKGRNSTATDDSGTKMRRKYESGGENTGQRGSACPCTHFYCGYLLPSSLIISRNNYVRGAASTVSKAKSKIGYEYSVSDLISAVTHFFFFFIFLEKISRGFHFPRPIDEKYRHCMCTRV